jgi:hypothetical protein
MGLLRIVQGLARGDFSDQDFAHLVRRLRRHCGFLLIKLLDALRGNSEGDPVVLVGLNPFANSPAEILTHPDRQFGRVGWMGFGEQ